VPPVPDQWLSHSRGRLALVAPVSEPAPAPAPAAAPAPDAAGDDEPISMPFGDLTVSEGTMIRWIKEKGDVVEEGDLVAEIETDKAVVEIEAPVSGTLSAIEAKVGQVIPMGTRIGGITR